MLRETIGEKKKKQEVAVGSFCLREKEVKARDDWEREVKRVKWGIGWECREKDVDERGYKDLHAIIANFFFPNVALNAQKKWDGMRGANGLREDEVKVVKQRGKSE